MVSISIFTATLNAADTIGRLGEDLLRQSDPDFRWIVIDGGSTDGTLGALPGGLADRTELIPGPDAGIYDALNKALARCRSTHYLVVGAADRLEPGAVAGFRRLAQEHDADLVAASVRDAAVGLARPGLGSPWRRGQHAYVAHHSVGTLIRTALHDRLGPYSLRFPIAADHLFIKSAVAAGARLHVAPDFVAGEFGRGGVSNRRYAQAQLELAAVQLQTEHHRGVQLLLLVWRLLRHWRRFTA